MTRIWLTAVLYLAIAYLAASHANGQRLDREPVNKKEAHDGLRLKYLWRAPHLPGELSISLYKGQRFRYTDVGCIHAYHSEGSWQMHHDTLTLTSDIQQHEVPIKISRDNDTTGSIDGFGISTLKYASNADCYTCLIYVNNDSVNCAPDMGKCLGTYETPHRLKVHLDNGMTSQWVDIPGTSGRQIHVTLLVDSTILSYVSLRREMYRVVKNHLLPID